jgi:hypothetical protein
VHVGSTALHRSRVFLDDIEDDRIAQTSDARSGVIRSILHVLSLTAAMGSNAG